MPKPTSAKRPKDSHRVDPDNIRTERSMCMPATQNGDFPHRHRGYGHRTRFTLAAEPTNSDTIRTRN